MKSIHGSRGSGGRALLPREAAERLTVSTRTLEGWRRMGRGPVVTYVGRLARYLEQDIEEFLASHRRVL